MVNGVELALLDQVNGIGKFKNDAAARFEQRAQPGNKIVCVRRVGEDVVAED